jgi:hypothetical protein
MSTITPLPEGNKPDKPFANNTCGSKTPSVRTSRNPEEEEVIEEIFIDNVPNLLNNDTSGDDTNDKPILSDKNLKNVNPITDPEYDNRSNAAEWCFSAVDVINGGRNACTIAGTLPVLASLPNAPIIAGASSAVASCMFLLTGALSIIISIAFLIPLSWEGFKSASTELEEAGKGENTERQKDATEALVEAKLCCANFFGALLMGGAQIFTGTVGICTTPFLTEALHISAFSSHALQTSLVASAGTLLGGIYVFRGIVQFVRAVRNLNRVNRFYEEFKCQLNAKDSSLDSLTNFLYTQRDIGEAYWKRRVDTSCSKERKSPEKEKIEYLKEVDKGIYSHKLKNQISLFIAVAMIIGGTISILLSFITGGIVPLVFGLVCCVAFILMEYVFLTVDLTYLYKKLLDRLYVQSKSLTKFLNSVEKSENSSRVDHISDSESEDSDSFERRTGNNQTYDNGSEEKEATG